ncbi:hypothetical protein GCM10009565_52890 [Amycolatopsis albidoflavus]
MSVHTTAWNFPALPSSLPIRSTFRRIAPRSPVPVSGPPSQIECTSLDISPRGPRTTDSAASASGSNSAAAGRAPLARFSARKKLAARFTGSADESKPLRKSGSGLGLSNSFGPSNGSRFKSGLARIVSVFKSLSRSSDRV